MAWLLAFGFLLNGNWEWLQTPFYDDGGVSVNTVVWYRFHCTLVDVVILAGCVLAVALVTRSLAWMARPGRGHLAAVALLGTAYTAVSEQVNVGVNASWGYSELMPVIPGTSIGVVPLLQWLVLPPLALWLARRCTHVSSPRSSSRGAGPFDPSTP